MNVMVTIDHHFKKLNETGEIYCKTIHDSAFWERYLSVYDQVYVLCRIKETQDKSDIKGYLLSSHPKVKFIGVPDFRGPKEYIINYPKIIYALRKELALIRDFIPIFRLPSTIGFLAYKALEKKVKIYGVEVVADPTSVYKKNGSAIHYFVEKNYSYQLRKICRNATGVAYVTEKYLQNLYPTRGITHSYTSLDLFDNFFHEKQHIQGFEIVHVGQINGEGKGHRTVIEAVKILAEKGFDVHCSFVGDGRSRKKFELLIEKYNLNKNFSFLGEISRREDLRNVLIKSDIFVFPSHSEGLPRSVIEAMACSLPVISTPICGIPEVVSENFLIEQDNYQLYAEKIQELFLNETLYWEESKKSYKKAEKYRYIDIMKKRKLFYSSLLKEYKQLRGKI